MWATVVENAREVGRSQVARARRHRRHPADHVPFEHRPDDGAFPEGHGVDCVHSRHCRGEVHQRVVPPLPDRVRLGYFPGARDGAERAPRFLEGRSGRDLYGSERRERATCVDLRELRSEPSASGVASRDHLRIRGWRDIRRLHTGPGGRERGVRHRDVLLRRLLARPPGGLLLGVVVLWPATGPRAQDLVVDGDEDAPRSRPHGSSRAQRAWREQRHFYLDAIPQRAVASAVGHARGGPGGLITHGSVTLADRIPRARPAPPRPRRGASGGTR